jgi:hypothetical protein
MRAKIARYQYKHNTMRYIDDLDSLVSGYNKTYHRSIRMRPVDVTEENVHVVYDMLYMNKKKVKVIPYQFKDGQSIRISGEKHPFRREFFQRWSEEIFTVSKRWRQNGVNMYKIKDCSEEEVVGSFYASELVLVTTAPEDTYRIKAFMDEKLEDGVKWVQVQWEGYPKACTQWILKSKITNA